MALQPRFCPKMAVEKSVKKCPQNFFLALGQNNYNFFYYVKSAVSKKDNQFFCFCPKMAQEIWLDQDGPVTCHSVTAFYGGLGIFFSSIFYFESK